MAKDRKNSDRDLIRGRMAEEDRFLDSMSPPSEVDEGKVRVGERIKAARTKAGLSLQDLADKTGFSSALLSQLENQVISPPLGAMIHIARALDCQVGHLVHDLPRSPYTIVRADEVKPVSRFASKEGVSYGYSYEALADISGGAFTPFLVTLEPEAAPRSLSTHDGQEFIYVLSGRVEVTLGRLTDVLKGGDSISYRSSVPHKLGCGGDKPALILAVLAGGEAENK